MAEDVAVPYVLPTQVDLCVGGTETAGDSVSGCGIDTRDRGGNQVVGHRDIERANAVRQREGELLADWLQRHHDVFERIHANGVFPAEFVRIGWFHRTIPSNSVDDLNVE